MCLVVLQHTRACVCASVRACVRACVRAGGRAGVLSSYLSDESLRGTKETRDRAGCPWRHTGWFVLCKHDK